MQSEDEPLDHDLGQQLHTVYARQDVEVEVAALGHRVTVSRTFSVSFA